MKSAVKRSRRVRRIVKKVFSSFFLGCVFVFVLGGIVLYYPEIMRYFDRFTVVKIDTTEIDTYYDLLSEYKQSGKDLVVDLGINDTDTLPIVINKLKNVMGLRNARIGFAYHNEEEPPAYIRRQGDEMTVFVSTKIKERREEISLLAHELSHIYVWRLKPSIFGMWDQEKLVDCASVFLGLGVVALNSVTDEYTVSPDGGRYEILKKTFGYLKPEQFACNG
ncbi:MAG: hypothetical protein ABIH71_00095 [Candidatus Omnitrophota bacterium]|nr:hypothetical protein [Candidatus Omnitrophota bacterium]